MRGSMAADSQAWPWKFTSQSKSSRQWKLTRNAKTFETSKPTQCHTSSTKAFPSMMQGHDHLGSIAPLRHWAVWQSYTRDKIMHRTKGSLPSFQIVFIRTADCTQHNFVNQGNSLLYLMNLETQRPDSSHIHTGSPGEGLLHTLWLGNQILEPQPWVSSVHLLREVKKISIFHTIRSHGSCCHST